MYFAAGHIAVKKDQDRSLCIAHEQYRLVALCDGIGEFKDSGRVAELLVEAIRSEMPEHRTELDGIVRSAQEGVKAGGLVGGTTLLCCYQCGRHASDEVTVAHLGNGAIFHLAGDFYERGPSQVPYRMHHVVLPHVDEQGVLVRHVSHTSGTPELALSETTLRLNSPHGDILLLVTDGIATLEEEMVTRDPSGTLWRLQASAMQQVLEQLHTFLSGVRAPMTVQTDLGRFVASTLQGLKESGVLEDDASLGVVVTEAVLSHYNKQRS
ncbi:MAG: protein phosphatase 2C domain-containing protein [Flavobacteriales bacterium]|nr:MAG: protein phosphatase 2C domain-containing protein [Flavobacteriales bacterium]